MTALDEPRAATQPPPPPPPPFTARRSPAGSWRFAARLARREVVRRPGRTALAALLIAVPVCAMTLGSLFARTNATDWAADFARDYGTADAVIGDGEWAWAVGDDGETPAEPEVPDGATVIGRRVAVHTQIVPSDANPDVASDVQSNADVTETWVRFVVFDADLPESTVGFETVTGRLPAGGEIALHPDTAEALGVDVGDRLELARPSGTWLVSGLVRDRGSYWDHPMLLSDFDVDRIDANWRWVVESFTMPPGTTDAELRALTEQGMITRLDHPNDWWQAGPERIAMAWGYVAGVLALVAVGIIVAAAFATSARRQLVTIGQLSANGATERTVRRTLALQGSWTGAIAAAVGVAAGFALYPLARTTVADHIVYHEIRSLRISVTDLIVIALTAVVAGTLAASVPGRSAARVPVMAALAGRRPAGQLPSWLVPTGLALSGGGLALVAVAALGANGDTSGNQTWTALVVLGGTAMVFGMCCASPLVVEAIGQRGRRTGLAWRMALRSLARARTRSAAVVAAIAVTVAGVVALGMVAEAAIRNTYAWSAVPADTLVIQPYVDVYAAIDAPIGEGPSDGDDEDKWFVDPSMPASIPLPHPFDDLLDSFGDGVTVTPLQRAVYDPQPFDSYNDYRDPYGPVIASDELLDAMGVSDSDRATLGEQGALYLWHELAFDDGPGGAGNSEASITSEFVSETGTIVVEAPSATAPPANSLEIGLLMTAEAARAAGFEIVDQGVIVRSESAWTIPQLDAIVAAQQELHGGQSFTDAFIEPGDPPRDQVDQGRPADGIWWHLGYHDPRWNQVDENDLRLAQAILVGIAVVLVSFVVTIGLALAAVEGRDERDAFLIVGARPGTMRRLTAARAAVITLVGIGLGVPLGFVPVWVVDRIVNDPINGMVPVSFPWLIVAAIVVGIPALVAAGAWATTGIAHRLRPPSPTRQA